MRTREIVVARPLLAAFLMRPRRQEDSRFVRVAENFNKLWLRRRRRRRRPSSEKGIQIFSQPFELLLSNLSTSRHPRQLLQRLNSPEEGGMPPKLTLINSSSIRHGCFRLARHSVSFSLNHPRVDTFSKGLHKRDGKRGSCKCIHAQVVRI
jgi:hypothetical protein